MAATTKRITVTKTRVYTVTIDIPNFSTVSDADTLASMKLPNGALQLGELLAGSTAYNGSITNEGASPWATSISSNIEPYTMFFPSTVLLVGDRISPSTPTNKLYTATAGTTGSVEPTWPTTNGQTVVSGSVTFTCIAKF